MLLPDSATSDRWETADRRFFAEAFDAAGLAEGTDYSIVNAEGDAPRRSARPSRPSATAPSSSC